MWQQCVLSFSMAQYRMHDMMSMMNTVSTTTVTIKP